MEKGGLSKAVCFAPYLAARIAANGAAIINILYCTAI
jgi:hypothetical protein